MKRRTLRGRARAWSYKRSEIGMAYQLEVVAWLAGYRAAKRDSRKEKP